jgi:hypothetical protein
LRENSADWNTLRPSACTVLSLPKDAASFSWGAVLCFDMGGYKFLLRSNYKYIVCIYNKSIACINDKSIMQNS